MRKKLHSYLPIAAIALIMSFGFSAFAEPPRDELVHAYHLLKKANHDYDGHREKAMEAVEAAGKDLGLELGGDLPDSERQWKSDDQLIEARKLLRDARDKLEAHDRDRVADHVETAIKEKNAALNVKSPCCSQKIKPWITIWAGFMPALLIFRI